eukprot:COSAG06_NODE_47201_length_341_cov_0.500000_1_plen_45_part_10
MTRVPQDVERMKGSIMDASESTQYFSSVSSVVRKVSHYRALSSVF